MQEAISYMAGSHVPGVIVNMQRGGPGLGDIGPSQGDYFQAVKGGGHGDHRNLVLAPATAQECYDFMFRAFALAFKYANPVMVLGDAIVGQIKEPVRREPPKEAMRPEAIQDTARAWRLEGYGKRGPAAAPRLLKSVYLAEGALAARNRLLMEKYEAMRAEAAFEQMDVDDAELVVVAFGSMARIARQRHPPVARSGASIGSVPARDLVSLPGRSPARLGAGAAFPGYRAEYRPDGRGCAPGAQQRGPGGLARGHARPVHRRGRADRPHPPGAQGEEIMTRISETADALRPQPGERLVFDVTPCSMSAHPLLPRLPSRHCPPPGQRGAA